MENENMPLEMLLKEKMDGLKRDIEETRHFADHLKFVMDSRQKKDLHYEGFMKERDYLMEKERILISEYTKLFDITHRKNY